MVCFVFFTTSSCVCAVWELLVAKCAHVTVVICKVRARAVIGKTHRLHVRLCSSDSLLPNYSGRTIGTTCRTIGTTPLQI